MLTKKIEKEIFEWIICFAFFFRQVAKIFGSGEMANTLGGNIDPFYLIIIPFFIYVCLKGKLPRWYIALNIGMATYAIFQLSVWRHINLGKEIINVVKIFICFSVLYMGIKFSHKIDYDGILEKSTFLFGIFTIYAMSLGRNSTVIWRLNDVVNTYSMRRLMLFYLEPSELGFHLAILIIFLVGRFLTTKKENKKIKYLILILVNVITLMLAKPMGAICCLGLAVGVMIILDFFVKFKEDKVISRSVIVFIGVLLIVIMYINESNIIMRVIDTFNGTDQSNSYRVNTANEILIKSFSDYKGLGCGFGNSGTDYFMMKYDLPTGIVNSFGRFIIETGVIGVLFLIALISALLYRCISDKNILKYGILVFLLSYQIFGSHFTNALIWWMYGFIIYKECVDECITND